MKRLIFVLFAACLLCLPYAAFAAEAEAEESTGNSYLTGEVGVEVRAGHASGSEAKANEYAPRESGMGVGVDLEWVKDQYQFRMDGSFNGGIFDTDSKQGFQKYDYDFAASLQKLDSYKIEAFAQRIIHNMSDGRRGFLDDRGNLYYYSDPESTTWLGGAGNVGDKFTYHKVRTNAGIGLEAAFGTPFFASVNLETKRTEGIMPLTNAPGTAGFGAYPLDYDVTMISGEFGYRADNLILKLDGSYDQLNDSIGELQDLAVADHYKRPIAESDNYKIGASLSWRIPSIKSTLMARASFANMTSDWMSTAAYYDNVGNAAGRWDDYKADIKNTVLNAAFTSRPIKGLTTKVYVNYFDRDNDSEVDWKNDLRAGAPGNGAAPIPGDRAYNYMAFYEFERLTVGAEAAYRFAGDYKVAAGYEYEGLDRSRYDATEVSKTDDNRVWARFDATINDMFAAHLRYQFLNRDSSETEPLADAVGFATPSGWEIAPWFSYADSASKRQHQIKAGVDFTPVEDLAIVLDYVFTYDDFTKKQELGLDDGYKHAVVVDLSYDFGPAQVALYGGVEYGTNKMNTRNVVNNSLPSMNPNQPDSSTAFNWDYEQTDLTWSFGLNGNIELVEDTLDLQLRYDFVKNDGKTDFSIPSIADATKQLPDIDVVDDYTEHMLSAILTYQMDEQNSFALGYSFTYLDYADWSYDNATAANKLADSYYNVDSSYEIHSVGLTYKYKF